MTYLAQDKGTQVYNVKSYGATGNGNQIIDGTITSNTAILTSATAAFTNMDVGKVIAVLGAGILGVPLCTTISAYTNATTVTLASTASTTVTNAITSYGTDDTMALQSAVNAATGGKVLIPSGTYMLTANLSITLSNIEIELAPGAIIMAAKQTDTSFKQEYRGIFHVCKSSAGSTQTNVYIHGGTIDCNTQIDTSAVSIWGSGNINTIIATQNIRIENMVFKNKANSVNSVSLALIHSVTDLNLGRIKNVIFKNCTFDTSDKLAIQIRGTYHDTVKIEDNEIKNIKLSSIDYGNGSENPIINRSSKNIYIRRNYFHDTMTTSQSFTVYDFGMASRTGIDTLVIEDNTFDSSNEYSPNDNPNLQIYASYKVQVRGNVFKNTRQALSLGYSNNATVFFLDPNEAIMITNNRFHNVQATITDYDSQVVAIWNSNVFYECGAGVFNAYSNHSYTIFENNLLYNMQANVESNAAFALYQPGFNPNSYPNAYRSAINIGGSNQYIVQNNVFVDDRALGDPTITTPSDASTVAGGSMGSRIYYFRYVYANVSGVTMASPSQSFSVGTNQLAKIQPTGQQGNFRPPNSATTPIGVSGIRQIQIYVGTSAGAETLQATINYPDFGVQALGWTENISGLVTGIALPSFNTTHNMTKYGIHEDTSAGGYLGPNIFTNNHFYGFVESQAIYTPNPTVTRWVRYGNSVTTNSTGISSVDNRGIYPVGNVTGAVVFSQINGTTQTALLTGNIMPTLTNGWVKGDELTLILTQDSVGNRTASSWSANLKFAYGGLTLSTLANAIDTITFRWDGTNWQEISRSLAVTTNNYTQGNISGSVTFNRTNGEIISATLTGNITVILSAAPNSGDRLILKLTQDSTGSRTATWPTNLKLAGGTLSLTTTANHTDIISLFWDGINWFESARSLNLVLDLGISTSDSSTTDEIINRTRYVSVSDSIVTSESVTRA